MDSIETWKSKPAETCPAQKQQTALPFYLAISKDVQLLSMIQNRRCNKCVVNFAIILGLSKGEFSSNNSVTKT